MKKKSDKQKEVDSLQKELEKARHLFVTSFEQLTVQQDFELRKAIRGAGGKYRVVKNSLAERASQETPSAAVLKGLAGMNSLAYTFSDPVALAKALTAYAKANPTFRFKAGIVEGRVLDIGAVQDLASLPSREELLAKILFLIQAPARRLVTVISGVGRNLAVVLDQGREQRKFKE